MCDLFNIIEVKEDSILETEQLGTKDKFWYCEDELNYLYKKLDLILGKLGQKK